MYTMDVGPKVEHQLRMEKIDGCGTKWDSKINWRDFPGSSVVKALHFQCEGLGFDPWLGN